MAHPLDEYPIHQAPVSMRYFDTSDRNVYDRCIMHCFRRDGEVELITGLGVYPHLGVIDAYATVRRGRRQWALRTSGALGENRMEQHVGPIRFEVIEPLRRIRAVCDDDAHGLAFDLTWDAASAPIDEPRHVQRSGNKIILDGCRFCQVGAWSGLVHVDGEELTVDDSEWTGTRDRSWGIRPVGEPEPAGRPVEEGGGFWWIWAPLRFDDFAVMVLAQERADGYRTMSDAVRIWPAETGRPPEQLGWPDLEIGYRSGTRYPERATIHLIQRGGKPLTLEVETRGSIALNIGAGYGGDPDWAHGMWKGEGWVDAQVYDLDAPEVAARAPFGVVDHVARATFDGAEGYGIFEHASIGRHDPSGFADLSSVAP